MGRSLTIRKPRKTQVRKLHLVLEEELESWQRRRAEAILLYAAGLNAIEIARALEVHINTVYNDLRAFQQYGLDAVEKSRSVGAPTRITAEQVKKILRLAEIAPYEIGLPYGRWSLNKLRDYLIKQRVMKKISRKHLWLLLKKGGCTFAAFGAKSSA